jgi:hypothetical protein
MAPAPSKPWYEQVPSLRRSVMLLVALPAEQRELIAKQATEFARSLSLSHRLPDEPEAGAGVGYDKVVAMMQLKEQGKAFANDPFLMKAMNETYKLPPEGRHQVGLKLLLCIQAIDAYEKEPGQSLRGGDAAARITLHNIVKKVFYHNLEVFQAQGEIKKQERIEQLEALQTEAAEMQAFLEAEEALNTEMEDPELEPESNPDESRWLEASSGDETITTNLPLDEAERFGNDEETDTFSDKPTFDSLEPLPSSRPTELPIATEEPTIPVILNRGPMRFEVSVSGSDLKVRAL